MYTILDNLKKALWWRFLIKKMEIQQNSENVVKTT